MPIRPILSSLLRNKPGAILVALQVAISLAILANALHIVNQRVGVASRPSGVRDEASLLYLTVHHLVKGSHEQQLARQQTETAVLRALGGVTSAAWTTQMPMSRHGSVIGIAPSQGKMRDITNAAVYAGPDSLAGTLGLKLIEGRDLASKDELLFDAAASRPVPPNTVLITRALAEKLWPDAPSVIGKSIYFGFGMEPNASRVVGVVDMLQTHGAETNDQGYLSMILPIRMTNASDSIYAVRAEPGQRERVMKEAEQALRRSSATPMIIKTRSVQQDRAERYRGDLALAWMLVTVSLLLLLVTASGIVGMASLWVTQRYKQIGVRRALGARRRDILAHFITENVMITSLGVAGGVPLAIGLNEQLATRLSMARLPLGYLVAGAVVFWALGALAAFGPAWRAASISPASATRST
jgi:putative ABC transport system permease protein